MLRLWVEIKPFLIKIEGSFDYGKAAEASGMLYYGGAA